MAKRKTRSKRSLSQLPKGLPVRNGKGEGSNPFEVSHLQKRNKFQVHNRTAARQPTKSVSALAQALQKRKAAIQATLQTSKKDNLFMDKRIGEYDTEMTAEQQTLARLVRERSRQSKRRTKYSLNDDDNEILTHRGQIVDPSKPVVILSDDEEDGPDGNLDALDTAMHFGGGGGGYGSQHRDEDVYGGSGHNRDLSKLYTSKKMELDDWIAHRKNLKAEKMQSKEKQIETFSALDESFAELKGVLEFRDKESEIRKHIMEKREGKLSDEDKEFDDWDKEMKEYMYTERKVKATDRTRTPEEIAKEEADRLHELETRRLARMNGDFDNDECSDVSDDETENPRRRKRPKVKNTNPEELSDDENIDDHENSLTTRFTADGLVEVDNTGLVVRKVGNVDKSQQPMQLSSELSVPLVVGAAVEASYRALEQFDGNESWFTGKVSRVNQSEKKLTYDIEYDDGDYEEGVQPRHVRVLAKSEQELTKERVQQEEEATKKRKRLKAKEKARSELPYVFEVPTTLDALHDIVSNFAKTGADASLIIQRIHKAHSVRLDKRNIEKMQNFYDVVIRRFVAVGDALYDSGDGGEELGRMRQLDSMTQTMFEMAQDAPEMAAAVWSRRIGFFESAHLKRLRDAELVQDNSEFTAWPSTGVILALRAVGHLFPVTDLRHQIVTPTMLLLGQILGYTPLLKLQDAVSGLFCASLLIEYTKESKRVVPEALSFLAGIIRLFAPSKTDRHARHPLPSFFAAVEQRCFVDLRERLCSSQDTFSCLHLSLQRAENDDSHIPIALLHSAIHMADVALKNVSHSVSDTEKELFAEIISSLLVLQPKCKNYPLPTVLASKISSLTSCLSKVLEDSRVPLQRRRKPSLQTIKSLAPRLENPEAYSFSKDKGKNATQAAADRARREYKREHKAVSRELRTDAVMIEEERQAEQQQKHFAAKEKRQKAFAWLESEQAVVNQQVRLGGGLLQGGGIGAAKAKAATAQLGTKKGGKLR